MNDAIRTREADQVIAKMTIARQALIEATSLQQIKQILDVAAAAELYSKRQQLGEEAEGYAHELKVYALAKLGEEIGKGQEAGLIAVRGQTKAKSSSTHGGDDELLTIPGLGISHNTSSFAQKLWHAVEDAAHVLDDIAKRRTTLTKVLRAQKAEDIRRKVSMPDAKYRVIYADPPWSYGNTQPDYHTEQRDHYPVMSTEDICQHPFGAENPGVSSIVEKHAVLFLWATSPMLVESLDVVTAWGFKYKAAFVWDKVKHNMGHYNSVRHELLLIAVRGSCQPDVPRLFDSVITEERREHSRKPDVFYEIIETLYPVGKRLEMFRRGSPRPGWDVFGYEAAAVETA